MNIERITGTDCLETSERLYRRYQSLATIKHYYGLLAIYGLCVTAELKGDAKLSGEVIAILEAFPDGHQHPEYNFPSYRIGGIPRAYQLYRGHMTDRRTRLLVEEYADEMMRAPRDEAGILCHPKSGAAAGLLWIDVAMAATPYLLFSGLGLGRKDLIDEAAKQAFSMYEVFTDSTTGLLHQCRGFLGRGVYSTDHWSRGNGWGIIAVTELAQHLPADSVHRPVAERLLVNHLKALLPWQNARGLWLQEVSAPQDPRNWEESSGTALFLYALGTAIRLGLLDDARATTAFRRGIDGLLTYCVDEDYSTLGCCHGCLAPGTGAWRGTPEAYMTECSAVRDEPHSFGPFMLAMTAHARLNDGGLLKESDRR